METRAATYDVEAEAVVIDHLTVRDEAVEMEGRRWASGIRSEPETDPDTLAAGDLTNFVTQALRLGSLAMTATGHAQDTFGLERLVKEVGDRTTDSSTAAAELTARAAKDAAVLVSNASEAAKKTISAAETQSRKQFTANVRDAKTELHTEIARLLGGENPELLDRLRPLLDKFGADLDAKAGRQIAELLEKAARQFDPSDPTSPMAKHAAKLADEQDRLARMLTDNHKELATKVDELANAVTLQTATHEAKTSLAKVTPIKGGTYAAAIHVLLQGIAVGLGDEYEDTGNLVGLLPRCMKGDGVLTADGGAARVVIEVTDSDRKGWNDYLVDAERNRAAHASLGLVRAQEQNAGQTIRVLGVRRIVVAFDPDQDDPSLLRTIVMLLRTASLAASGRSGADEVETAQEKVNEALEHLQKIDAIKKITGTIEKGAAKIDRECESLNATIRRLLGQALAALAGADPIGPAGPAAALPAVHDGAA